MITRLKHVARRVWATLRGCPDPVRFRDAQAWTVVDHEETLIEGRLWRRARFANGTWSAYRLVNPEPAPPHSP